jgi:hypothetical protein
MITIVLGGARHTDPASDRKTRTLQSQHHKSSGYQPCLHPVDLTMKANPCLRNEERKQELERMQLNGLGQTVDE